MKYTLIALAALSGTTFGQTLVDWPAPYDAPIGSSSVTGTASGIDVTFSGTSNPPGLYVLTPSPGVPETIYAHSGSGTPTAHSLTFSTAPTDDILIELWSWGQTDLVFSSPFTVEAIENATISGNTLTGPPSGQKGHAVLRFDPASSVSWTGLTSVSQDGIQYAVSLAAPIPEPSSAALLGLGGLALILRRRKYKL